MQKANDGLKTVCAPPSKSASHRAIICAMLSHDDCIVKNVILSADVKATLDAAMALGRKCSYADGKVMFAGFDKTDKVVINCNESGSTFRFLLPICTALGVETTFVGKGKLPDRPYKVLADAMSKHGVIFDKTQGLPMTVSGRLQSGVYEIAANESSQYITGLLFALPLLDGNSEIVLTGQMQSQGYVDMTLEMLAAFGIEIEKTAKGYFVKGNQKYKNKCVTVEGDYSNAAFWLVYGALNDGITVSGLNANSTQGDKAIVDLLQKMGAHICIKDDRVIVEKSKLNGINIDVGQIPDLAPILAVALAFAKGGGSITNAARLKIKECDRLQAIYDNFTALGIGVKLHDDGDGITIQNTTDDNIDGGKARGFNDHRIVMSMAVLATKSESGIIIDDMEAVNKSYPDFFQQYKKLGGRADVIDLG